MTTAQAAQNGSDIEFFRHRGKDYALAGTSRNGLQVNDVTDPSAPAKAAVYDCPITQGDIQVFRQGPRVLATYTADSAIVAARLGSQCVSEANALGFGVDGIELGTFLVDLTVPSPPPDRRLRRGRAGVAQHDGAPERQTTSTTPTPTF